MLDGATIDGLRGLLGLDDLFDGLLERLRGTLLQDEFLCERRERDARAAPGWRSRGADATPPSD